MTIDIKLKLQAELGELESELRIHLPKEIKRALEFGDLRENSEYQTALQRQTMVKARIRELRQRISEISSIDLSRIPRDKAAYGSTLVVYDAEREEEVTYRLVTPEESDPARHASPPKWSAGDSTAGPGAVNPNPETPKAQGRTALGFQRLERVPT